MPCLTQIMETFSDNHRLQSFDTHWYREAILRISNNRLLSSHGLFRFNKCFDNSVSCMHSKCVKDFVWMYILSWTPFKSSMVNKAVIACFQCNFLCTRHCVRQFGCDYIRIIFSVVLVICFPQHFKTMLIDDVVNFYLYVLEFECWWYLLEC